MKYAMTFFLSSLLLVLSAQPDAARMERDIEVAENILATLVQEEYGGDAFPGMRWSGGSGVEGAYIDGFGVLFTIGTHFRVMTVAPKPPKPPKAPKVDMKGDEAVAIVVPEARVWRNGVSIFNYSDSLSREQHFRSVVETFATEYAYLLRQLPKDEKIMIRYGGQGNQSFSWGNAFVASSTSNGAAYSAAIAAADLQAYKAKRLDRQALVDRIQYVTTVEGGEAEDRDLKLLSSIFGRLYQQDLSELFTVSGPPAYEKIEGLGAIYHLRFFTPGATRGDLLSPVYIEIAKARRDGYEIVVPDLEAETLEPEEWAEKIDAAYPEFLEDLKANIVEYGSIAKDLEAGEALLFRIHFPSCESCVSLPEQIEITARQETLQAYREGKLSLERAVGQLAVE